MVTVDVTVDDAVALPVVLAVVDTEVVIDDDAVLDAVVVAEVVTVVDGEVFSQP